jgi:predicted phosphoribosyltransferase
MMEFKDRRDAGKRLAQKLMHYAGRPQVVVLALPRGGVPVGYEVARALHLPLDILIVRKLGLPGREELALGAIASGGIRVLNTDIIRMLNIPGEVIDFVAARELQELNRREHSYRGDQPALELRDCIVILVDDGLATGASMRAAVAGVRARHPALIVVAIPTASREACEAIRPDVEEIVCVQTPEPFYGVGRWYQDFSQVSDEEVRILFEEANRQGIHS